MIEVTEREFVDIAQFVGLPGERVIRLAHVLRLMGVQVLRAAPLGKPTL